MFSLKLECNSFPRYEVEYLPKRMSPLKPLIISAYPTRPDFSFSKLAEILSKLLVLFMVAMAQSSNIWSHLWDSIKHLERSSVSFSDFKTQRTSVTFCLISHWYCHALFGSAEERSFSAFIKYKSFNWLQKNIYCHKNQHLFVKKNS